MRHTPFETDRNHLGYGEPELESATRTFDKRGINVLVVDDDQEVRNMLKEFLSMEGYKPVVAGSAREAMDAMEATRCPIVITDLRMPRTNGEELMTWILDRYPDTSVIIMTGYASVESAVRSLTNGAAGYVLKPLRLDELRVAVDRALEMRSLSQDRSRLSQLSRKLAEVERAKASLLSVVSHEFRTPVTAIRGSLYMLKHAELPGEAREAVGAAEESLERLETMVANLLVIAEHQCSISAAPGKEIDLGEVIVKVIDHFVNTQRYWQRDIVVEIPDHLPPVKGNPEMLYIALCNLVENALKFSPEDEKVYIEGRQLDRSLGDDGVEISVVDHGEGIPEDALQHAFDEFWQRDMTHTRRTGGSGLGLAAVKCIIEAHRGTIGVRSSVGEGSRFAVYLPREW